MRYGKIYFFDRFGRRTDGGGGIMGSSSSTGMLMDLGRANGTRGDALRGFPVRFPQQGNLRIIRQPAPLPSRAFHPDYPIRPQYFSLEDLANAKPPNLTTGNAKNDPLLDQFMASEEFGQQQGNKSAAAIMALDELKTPTAESIESKRERLAQELAELALDERQRQWQKWGDGTVQEERRLVDTRMDAGQPENITRKQLDDCEKTEDGKEQVEAMMLLDEIGSLCDECRAEEEAEKANTKKTEVLSQKLNEHVNEMNWAEMERHKMSQQKQEETEAAEEHERWIKERDEHEKQVELEAAEQERAKRVAEKEKEEMEMTEQRRKTEQFAFDQPKQQRWPRRWEWDRGEVEGQRPEWWERKKLSADEKVVAVKNDGSGLIKPVAAGENDRTRAEMLMEQLRRNETLKKSIERLEQFKQRAQEEAEQARDLARRKHKWARKKAILDRSDVETGETAHGSLPPQIGIGRRRRADASVHPKVLKAWREATEANEKRYRILQDNDGRSRYRTGREMVIERKRCRRCKKPIKERKYIRYVQIPEQQRKE